MEAISKEERTWGMVCHLSALAGYLIPFGNIIGPLIVWLIKKEEMPFVADQGKESLNFQITMAILAAICVVLIFVAVGIFLLFALGIINLILVVIATIKANDGQIYRYPFALRLIK